MQEEYEEERERVVSSFPGFFNFSIISINSFLLIIFQSDSEWFDSTIWLDCIVISNIIY